jgi:hypothetical protein
MLAVMVRVDQGCGAQDFFEPTQPPPNICKDVAALFREKAARSKASTKHQRRFMVCAVSGVSSAGDAVKWM